MASPITKDPKTITSVALRFSEREALRLTAAERGLSMSEVVRQALEEHIRDHRCPDCGGELEVVNAGLGEPHAA